MNVGQLNAAVLVALNREQDPQATGLLPTWRAFAEADIFANLRAGYMMRRGGAIFVNPVSTLPPSILQIAGVALLRLDVPAEDVSQLVDGNGNPVVWEGTPEVLPGSTIAPDPYVAGPLEPLGPGQVDGWVYDIATAPTHYLVEGFTVRLLPWTPPNAWVDITYYSAGEPLVVDADFNEVLSRTPSLYLYGMLLHAAIFYGDADGEGRWRKALVDGVTEVNRMTYGWQGTGWVARVG
jgi:hypothetical protein